MCEELTCTRHRPASKVPLLRSSPLAAVCPLLGAAARAMDRADLGMVVEEGITYSPCSSYLHTAMIQCVMHASGCTGWQRA